MEELIIALFDALFDPITASVILGIVVVAFWKRDKNLVTLFGIFGTFIGIVIGLHGIDSQNIANSIPNLLSGLYTAFYTSIAGLLASIILTLTENNENNKESEDFLKDISLKLSDLIELQSGIGDIADIKKELISLNKNVGGDGDSSLLSQIQKLRTSFTDKQDELKRAFDEFAKSMAENNMKALIEAIQQVMEDFNTKINDQLGQSFKELTTAIDNLLKWQEEYKNNIIASTEALNLSKDSLEKSSKGFEITVEKAEQFSGISVSLGEELKSLNNSLDILKGGLKEFDGIAQNNKEASQLMLNSIDSLKNNFVSKAEVMISESENHIKNMKQAFETQSKDLKESHTIILEDLRDGIIKSNKISADHFEKVGNELGKHSQTVAETFEKQSKDLTKTHATILEDLKNNVDNTNKNVSQQFERIGEELEKQVIKLDNELGEALDKSLSSLGRELTSITNKFTQQLSDLNTILVNNK